MTRAVRVDRLWWWYLLAAGAALVLITVTQQHGWQSVATSLYLVTVTAGTVAVVVGLIRFRPRAWVSWLCIAGSQAMFTAGSVAVLWFPGLADLLYLTMEVFLIGALLGFVRSRATRGQHTELLDASIITTGAALMTWLHLIAPLAHIHGVPLSERVVGVAYPLLDLMMVAVAARLALAGGKRPAAYYLITVGLGIFLASDIAFAYLRVTGGNFGPDSLIVVCPLVGVILMGAAGLHPSMTQLDERPLIDDTTATGRRIAFLAMVSLVAPAELVATAVRGNIHRSDILVIAGTCVVLVLLTLTRMAGLVAAHRNMALTDPLTGLVNRRRFTDALAVECGRTVRRRTQVGVIIIDVDFFKKVNDTYGHAAGDEVLREVARRLRSLCRRGDVVARIGGEEIAVLVPDADLAGLTSLADRLREAVSADLIAVGEGTTISVTVSLGVAACPADAPTGEGALAAADEALYEAKRTGRDRVVASPEVSAQTRVAASTAG